jgi:hypothetical protein
MRRSLILVLAAALAVPTAAAAKGPESATVDGPGGSIAVSGDGEGGRGTPLGNLVENGGFFPAVFARSPDPMLTRRPSGDLGPRYTVTYVVPGPGGDSRIEQDVYPYAQPTAVTYMRPGQRFWGGEQTHGGWYVATGDLTTSVGLPETAPSGGDSSRRPWRAGALALVVALGAAVLYRRIPRTRAAPARP